MARKRTPLTVSCILAAPLYFLSLMLVSLAIDRPTTVSWTPRDREAHHDLPPDELGARGEDLAGRADPLGHRDRGRRRGRLHPLGTYVVCAAMLLVSAALPHKLDTWQKHHTMRYPPGRGLIPDSSPNNLLSQGEWEQSARETILSLQKWMIGLAILFALGFALADELRRRRGNRAAPALGLPAVAGTTDDLLAVEGQSQLLRGRGATGRPGGGPLRLSEGPPRRN